MKHLLTMLITIMCSNCFAQTKAELDKILQFKNDPLTKAETFRPDILIISSMLLTREKFDDVRCILTYPKNQNIVYCEYYYNNTTTLNSTMTYDVSDNLIGLSKEYDVAGNLVYTVDWDKGTWTIVDPLRYPNYQLQQKMKEKADSLIKVKYSQDFFVNHVIWESTGSYVETDSNSYHWTDSSGMKPKVFRLSYSVKLDKNHIYRSMIHLGIDSLGQLAQPDWLDPIYGFEDRPKDSEHNFKITCRSAFELARKNGLVVTDSTRTWPDDNLIWKGRFLFRIAQLYKSEKVVPSESHSIITEYYNLWIFDPWSGELIECKPAKKVIRYNSGCLQSSDFMDINE